MSSHWPLSPRVTYVDGEARYVTVFPPSAKERKKKKNKGITEDNIWKTKQSITSRLESWRLLLEVLPDFFFVSVFWHERPRTIKSSITGKRNSPELLRSGPWLWGSSHLIIHNKPTYTRFFFKRTVQQKETKIDPKIDLIYVYIYIYILLGQP